MIKEDILKALSLYGDKLCKKKVVIGFDGYIDTIYKVVKNRIDENNFTQFQYIKEFGRYIEGNDLSCDIEIIPDVSKIGGNAPIMANAMACLGFSVNCIGAFGVPEVNRVFHCMSQNCRIMSIGNPAVTTALEFENGKIMLGDIESLNKIDWVEIKNHIDIDILRRTFSESGLIAITNWSQMINSNNILFGLNHEIMPYICENSERYMFFDLADPSRRSQDDINRMLNYIMQFNRYSKVVLGLNKKESKIIYRSLYGAEPEANGIEYIALKLNSKLNIDTVVIHSLDSSVICSKGKTSTIDSLKINKPRVLTGSGDNFNSGLCLGLLLELYPEGVLTLATASAAFYIKNGRSASIGDLDEFIRKEF